MSMIERPRYLERLIRNMWNGEVKVITGIRRCGKSVLLFELFYAYLKSQGVSDDCIIAVKLDQRRNSKFRNPLVLCDHVEALLDASPAQKFYLLVDEVQLTRTVVDESGGGEKISLYEMLNELKDHPRLDVYVTGSNSRGLSKDILTEFRGRATQIRVNPLSFAEFYSSRGGDERQAFDDYMLYGGMPRIAAIDDERDKKEYLSSLFSELYIKDIVERHRLGNAELLNVILDYLSSQISSLTNPTKVANALCAASGKKINSQTVADYMVDCTDAFLVSEAKRYDIKGKSYFRYPSKYYFCDLGLRNARLNFRQYDPGHMMENIIYNELIGRGYSVDVGVVTDRKGSNNRQREIDFVVNDADRKIYIQSALRMDNEEKSSSELQSLYLTGDFFKKIVMRMDVPRSFYDERGIFHCALLDFLLDRVELF